MRKIRIGNSSGFWGDAPDALYRMASAGDLDYLTCDYLAEVSMSVLRKQQQKNPTLGFVKDFMNHFEQAASELQSNGIKLITNAGGNNPRALASEVYRYVLSQRLDLKVVAVEGDNVLGLTRNLSQEELSNFETGESFSENEFQSANAYIGVAGLLKALELEADIIIAGRVTDSALALAPMIHEFQWSLDDYDKLGSGMIAAHCIECGAQVTGGNFTDWQKVTNWNNMGFPIIEMKEDGVFYVTKHENTGGLVSVDTVKEQLVYEIADPARYYSPDVISDLTSLTISLESENRVKVEGGKGHPSTPFYKVSASYADGFKAVGELIISGADALKKAQLFQEIFWDRLAIDFLRTNTEFVGYNSCHGSLVENNTANEVLLKLYVHDLDKNKVESFSQSVASLILSGPQGVAVIGGRPRVQEVISYWPFLINKNELELNVYDPSFGRENLVSVFRSNAAVPAESNFIDLSTKQVACEQGEPVSLSEICLARSGDKGNSVNIGVVARSDEAYNYLKKYLTPGLLKEWFETKALGNIKRYEIKGLKAFNFILEQALDGGGTKALRIDAQGKTFAAALLNQKLRIPQGVVPKF